MNFLQYEAVLKTLECGTLSKAAEELGYTQSGLSRMINSLEEELGLKIAERGRGGFRLTTEGEMLIPHIRAVVAAQNGLKQAVENVNGLTSGIVRIGTFNSASAQWLPGMIKEFSEKYPGIKFELIHGPDEYTRRLAETGRVDMTFTDYPTSADLEEIFLIRDPIVAIFASDDPHSGLEHITLKELEHLPYVALNEGVDDEITRLLTNNEVELHPRFSESDDHAVIAMVEQGLGTSLMSEMMLQGFDARIAMVPLDPPSYRRIGVGFRSPDTLSLAAKTFLEHLRDWISRHYGSDQTMES